MTFNSAYIPVQSISEAWTKALQATLHPGTEFLAPLVVQIERSPNIPLEDDRVHQLLDDALEAERLSTDKKQKPYSIATTANTIFPENLYKRLGRDPQNLYARYKEMFYRKLRRVNPYGTYFMRMCAFGADNGKGIPGKNQLLDLVDCYTGAQKKAIHRASLLQVGILDPSRDLLRQAQRGFPCLQQIAFTPQDGELAVTAFYATQLIFERGYGNYLGLWQLGEFVAEQLKLRLTCLTCVSAKAKAHDGGPTHAKLRELIKKIEKIPTNE